MSLLGVLLLLLTWAPQQDFCFCHTFRAWHCVAPLVINSYCIAGRKKKHSKYSKQSMVVVMNHKRFWSVKILSYLNSILKKEKKLLKSPVSVDTQLWKMYGTNTSYLWKDFFSFHCVHCRTTQTATLRLCLPCASGHSLLWQLNTKVQFLVRSILWRSKFAALFESSGHNILAIICWNNLFFTLEIGVKLLEGKDCIQFFF